MTAANAPMKNAKPAQLRLTRRSPAYWRVTIDNPPLNVMGPVMVQQFQEVINALEADEQVRVVVFDSAVDEYFLNHSDFTGKLEDPDLVAARSHGPAAMARLSGASDPPARRIHRAYPRTRNGQRQRNHARLRHEFCQP